MALISLLTTAGVSFGLLILPFYSTGQTVVQVSGPMALIAIATPVVISLAANLFSQRLVCAGAAAALIVFALLASFSIGLFYAPSAALMLAAAIQKFMRHEAK